MNRFTKKMTSCLIALAALAAIPASAQKSADTLRWASTSSITTMDPYYQHQREQMIIHGQLVWDTLVFRDPDNGNMKPLLAKSWRWLDDTTIEFNLREDVKWHDGQPLTADDAVYTFNYISDPANKINVPSNVNWIKRAEKSGPLTFKLFLKAPFPAAFEYLSAMLAVVPKDFYGPGGVPGANGRLVGTGPYKLVKFNPGATVDLERFDGYFGNSPKGKGAIKNIRYRVIPDGATQMAELLSGGVDWVWYVPSDQAQQLASVKKLIVKPAETMRISYLGFNMRDMPGANPVQNIKVRQAIAHAIDREKLVKHVIGDGASIPKAACYRTQFGCRQDVAQYEYDPVKSKKLLAEAGFTNGLTVDLVAFRSREWTEAVAGYLNAVGIKTNVSVLPFPAANDRVLNNTLHLYLAEWGSYSINDASAILNNFFTLAPNDIAQDKELAAMVKTAGSTTDPKTRVATYSKALGRIADQVYWQPLWVHPVVYAHSADLDFKPFPDENPRFFLTGWKK